MPPQELVAQLKARKNLRLTLENTLVWFLALGKVTTQPFHFVQLG